MSAVKVGAHPLVVAVAMGLLGPSALTEIEHEDQSATFSGGMFEVEAEAEVPEPPSDDEFARIENLWHEVRTHV